MSIFYNGTDVSATKHGVARSSKIKESNHIYDLIDTVNDVDNAANIKVGAHTGNGLQERTALTPTIKDQIAFVCTPPLIYDSSTSEKQAEYNFYNVKGKDFKAYEITKDDQIGISQYSITALNQTTKAIVKGNYIVVNASRGWTEVVSTSAPSAASYGFIGRVVGFETYSFDTIVIVEVVQNITVA